MLAFAPSEIEEPATGMIEPPFNRVKFTPVLAGAMTPVVLAPEQLAVSLLAGALLAFAFAMLEVSDSIILAQRSNYFPITKAILDYTQRLGDGLYVASALGVWAMVLLPLTIIMANSSGCFAKGFSDTASVIDEHVFGRSNSGK